MITLFFYNLFWGAVESWRRWRARRHLTAYNRLLNQMDEWNGIILDGGWDDLKRPFVIVAGQRRYIPEWLVREINRNDVLRFKGGCFLLKSYR